MDIILNNFSNDSHYFTAVSCYMCVVDNDSLGCKLPREHKYLYIHTYIHT